MIVDEVQVKFIAGKGGHGAATSPRFVKKATGGDGGRGGSIFLEGSSGRFDLKFAKNRAPFKAQNGGMGKPHMRDGGRGDDLVLKVPLITEIYDMSGQLIHSIENEGEKVLIAQGGDGGLGNYSHRKEEHGWTMASPGEKGERLDATLKLILTADVIFIGFPNAGKSSVLNELTNANVKVAPYPFTTLDPNLGMSGKLKLMDLPGLIEGTHEGKGLGVKFLKHTDRAKLVAHFISLESENTAEEYEKMRNELKKIDDNLYDKKEIIVLTKHDLLSKDEIERRKKSLAKYSLDIIVTSIHDWDSLQELKAAFERNVEK